MRVLVLRDHSDQNGNPRRVGDEYETPNHRAGELHQSGAARMLEAVQTGVSWDQSEGRVLTPFAETAYLPDAAVRDHPRVLQLTRYDPGSAAYRYHSAFNHVPGGTSAFVRYGHDNPYCDLRQYDGDASRVGVAQLFDEADAVHVHMDYTTLDDCVRKWPTKGRQLLVRHYHGSQASNMREGSFVQNALDQDLGALQIGARLYHNRFSDTMQWVPIPVPVRDYEAIRAKHFIPMEQRTRKNIRIAHSPTHSRIKGTIVLEYTIQDLQAKGLPVEVIMIQNRSHAEALAMKASCDITFDSFWLGIQGSGLEAACMGQPVVAGDSEVKAEYEQFLGGPCPYTFTLDALTIKETLEQLIVDPIFREAEASRVGRYVRAYHDYPVVGARYWAVLTQAMKERNLVAA